jgi:predicted peptidase
MKGKWLGLFGGVVVSSFTLCASATDVTNSVTGMVTDGRGSINYRLFEPTRVAAGQKLPLVVFLHGMGERGTDNVRQTTWMGGLLDHTQTGQYASYVLAPQIDSSSWFQSWSQSSPTEAMKLTIQAVKNVIKSENVDTSRVYVTGVSMGGMGTWDILERDPELFAAAVPMSGGGDPRSAAKIKDIPVWAFHGGADDLVPVTATRDMIAALKEAGANPRYTELVGQGHVIWNPIYDDPSNTLYPWLFGQHRDGADNELVASASPAPRTPVLASTQGLVSVGSIEAAVPEPGVLGIIGVATFAALARRRGRSR